MGQINTLHRKKKVREFPVPSRDDTTKLSLGGNNDVVTELFLPRGSLISDIPAEDSEPFFTVIATTKGDTNFSIFYEFSKIPVSPLTLH